MEESGCLVLGTTEWMLRGVTRAKCNTNAKCNNINANCNKNINANCNNFPTRIVITLLAQNVITLELQACSA